MTRDLTDKIKNGCLARLIDRGMDVAEATRVLEEFWAQRFGNKRLVATVDLTATATARVNLSEEGSC